MLRCDRNSWQSSVVRKEGPCEYFGARSKRRSGPFLHKNGVGSLSGLPTWRLHPTSSRSLRSGFQSGLLIYLRVRHPPGVIAFLSMTPAAKRFTVHVPVSMIRNVWGADFGARWRPRRLGASMVDWKGVYCTDFYENRCK